MCFTYMVFAANVVRSSSLPTCSVFNGNVTAGDALLSQFGISANQHFAKIIITEIGG